MTERLQIYAINLRLDPADRERLDTVAGARGIPRVAALREALRWYSKWLNGEARLLVAGENGEEREVRRPVWG